MTSELQACHKFPQPAAAAGNSVIEADVCRQLLALCSATSFCFLTFCLLAREAYESGPGA
jgi:hypothetical protein